MRIPLVAVLMLVPALAGCFGGDDAGDDGDDGPGSGDGDTGGPGIDDPDPAATGPILLLGPFQMTSCSGLLWGYPADAGEVQDALPDGFTAVTDDGSVEIVVQWLQCGFFVTQGYEGNDTWFGDLFVAVEEPDVAATLDGTGADPTAHAYRFQALAGDDILADLWTAAGYPLHNGTTAFETTETPLAAQVEAQAGDYAWSCTLPVGGDDDQEVVSWYTRTEEGDLLVWTGAWEIQARYMGPCDMEMPADSPFAPFYTGDARLLSTSVSLVEASWPDQHLWWSRA